MNKQDRKMRVQSKEVWKQRVRDYWPVVPLSAMGVLTMFAMSHQSAHADGGTWTLPYTGSGSNPGDLVQIYNSSTGAAIHGYHSATSGTGTGTSGNSASPNGIGTFGGNSASTGNSVGVEGITSSPTGYAVYGQGNAGTGVYGYSSSGNSFGVYGYNSSGSAATGVYGNVNCPDGYGVVGGNASGTGNSIGVEGVTSSPTGYGVYGRGNGTGVYGTSSGNSSNSVGVEGVTSNPYGYGVYGIGNSGTGVTGISTASSGGNSGVVGTSNSTAGVYGYSINSVGARGYSHGDKGVDGYSDYSTGVAGHSTNSTNYGVAGYNSSTSGNAIGVYGTTSSSNGYAGWFQGNANVTGTQNAGNFYTNGSVTASVINAPTKYFKIDHPLDPANKYLVHSCVESNERLDMYNGIALLDSDGKVTVEMPGYFEALNKDFRYQLTAIGAPGPNLYIAEEMDHNKFVIAGGSAGMKVSWQVTGVRHDAYAAAHPMQVEQDKSPKDRGKYVTPIEQGQPETQGLNYIKPVKTIAEDVRPPKPPALPKTPPSVPKMPTLPQLPKMIKASMSMSSKP